MQKLEIGINIGDRDLSFVDAACEGGISEDGSPLTGDVTFDDVRESQTEVSNEEFQEFLNKVNSRS